MECPLTQEFGDSIALHWLTSSVQSVELLGKVQTFRWMPNFFFIGNRICAKRAQFVCGLPSGGKESSQKEELHPHRQGLSLALCIFPPKGTIYSCIDFGKDFPQLIKFFANTLHQTSTLSKLLQSGKVIMRTWNANERGVKHHLNCRISVLEDSFHLV